MSYFLSLKKDGLVVKTSNSLWCSVKGCHAPSLTSGFQASHRRQWIRRPRRSLCRCRNSSLALWPCSSNSWWIGRGRAPSWHPRRTWPAANERASRRERTARRGSEFLKGRGPQPIVYTYACTYIIVCKNFSAEVKKDNMAPLKFGNHARASLHKTGLHATFAACASANHIAVLPSPRLSGNILNHNHNHHVLCYEHRFNSGWALFERQEQYRLN